MKFIDFLLRVLLGFIWVSLSLSLYSQCMHKMIINVFNSHSHKVENLSLDKYCRQRYRVETIFSELTMGIKSELNFKR